MWSEILPSGKVRYSERYTDPMTGKTRHVGVTMDKDTTRNRKAAMLALSDKIDAKMSQAPVKSEKLTMQKLIDLYLEYQHETVKASTYRRNENAYRTISRLLGSDTLVDALSARYIREKIKGDRPSTFNERLTRLKAMLRWGYANDYVSDIRYLDKIKPLPDAEGKEKLKGKYLETDELSRLLESMTIDRWRLLTEFLVLSGLRVGEALALEDNDVDLKESVIRITKTRDPVGKEITTPKTATSTRDVFIQPELMACCRKIKSYTATCALGYGYRTTLFICDIHGEHADYYAYTKYLKAQSMAAIGRSVTPHALRHTHTSLMAAAGVPLETISRRLGHADSKVTRDIYLHITQGLKERDMEQLRAVRIL